MAILTNMKQIVLVVMNLFFCLELYYSEWWEVVLSGDRCLYPDSFHIFVSEVCVGSLNHEGGSSHKPLCLPLNGAEELLHLPITDDRTLFSFNVLDFVLRFLFVIPLLIVLIQQQQQKNVTSNHILCGAVHFGSAMLLAFSILVVILAPTASSKLWAQKVLTCDVTLNPGAGPLIAFSGLLFELVIAIWYLNA